MKYSSEKLDNFLKKNNSYQFVASKIDNDIASEPKKVVAGHWVFKDFIEYKNSSISQKFYLIPNSLNSFQDIKNDNEYIKELINIYSLYLKDFLNRYHNTNYPQRYWDILILPWLNIYIASQLIRWRIIEKTITKDKTLLFSEINLNNELKPCTTHDYIDLLIDNHEFNYSIFKNILTFLKDKRKEDIVFIQSKLIKSKTNKKNLYFKKIKIYFYKLIEKFNDKISKKNLIYIDPKAFKSNIFIKLNLKLNQLPTILFNKNYQHLLSHEIKYDRKSRENINLLLNNEQKKEDFFVDFLNGIIGFDIPKSFLEGYKIFNDSINNILLNPKIIISSYHDNNERLKLWIAKNVNDNRCTFFQLQHGAQHQQKFPACHGIDSKTADKRLIWSQSRERNDIQMPSSKFMGLKKLKNKGLYLTYVEKPNFTFPKRINQDENFFVNIKNIILLKKYLNQSFFKNLIYTPSASNYDAERQEVSKILGKNKIQKKLTLHKSIEFSKILICPYAETAFLECLLSGRPTILINPYPKIPFNDDNEETHRELIKSKISFENAKDAALHINKIGDNPDFWWNSKDVQNAILNFKNKFCKIEENSVDIWKKFLINELGKKY